MIHPVQAWRQALNSHISDYRQSVLLIRTEKEHLVKAEFRVENLTRAQQIFQEVAQGIQQQIHARLAMVVSKCLAMVWEDPYEFRIDFVQKRGKTEAVLKFIRDGQEVSPLKAAGGGVTDIAAFALRVACMSLRVPKVRSLVIQDEPFRYVSPGNRLKVRTMLEVLAAELGFQFVFVTHQDELRTGTVIDLTQRG